jgi:hypothetical protein
VDGIAIERNYLAGASIDLTPIPGGQCIRFGDGRHQLQRDQGHPRELSREEIWGALGGPQGQRGLTANYFFKPAKHVFRNWRLIEKGLYANSRNEGK